MTDERNSDIQAAIDAGFQQAAGDMIHEANNGDQYLQVRRDYKLERIPALNPRLPAFIEESVGLVEQDSFCAYVNRYRSPDTVIFAKPGEGNMRARLDYHKPEGQPSYNAHTAVFHCDFEPNWARWRKIDRQFMSQVDFAYFVEEMMHTIGAPDGGELLDMAQNLKINRSVVFKSNKILRNGTVDIEYVEGDNSTDGRGGHVTVPDTITVVTPIYMMRAPQETYVKLRYRVDKGEPLKFRIDILNREEIELKAFIAMAEEVNAATECPVYLAG